MKNSGRRSRRNALMTAGVAAFFLSSAQAADIVPGPDDWTFTGKSSGTALYKGAPALSLFNGTAWLNKVRFRNGTIAFKVSFPKDRGFVGVRFRAQDADNYEHFYLRPHQGGMPDANQYTPVFHGNTGWQIYHSPRFSAPVEYAYGSWIDVKLVVSGDRADVYIDSDKPVLHIADLKREDAAGSIGFDSFLSHAFISDVKITPAENPRLSGEAAPLPELPAHLVKVWEVSGPVAPVTPETDIAAVMAGIKEWRRLPVETNGVANLGRIAPAAEGSDTILARITVKAERASVRRLHFGYSDKTTAYVNGKPVYQGDNTYRTRDFRYLGTVGRFDTLILPLAEGRNEIVFAVQEDFGGWAVTAAFDDMEGIAIAPRGASQ